MNKTDRNDARTIAGAMRCNLYKEVHQKSKESIDIHVQLTARRTLIKRPYYKNTIRGIIKAYGIRLGTVSHQNFSKAVREAIKDCEEPVKVSIEGLLKSYEEVCKNCDNADKALEELSKNDPVIQLFKSIPGVGMITALTYKATIDNPNRFANARDVGAYLGLTPNQYSSGEVVRQGGISKSGSSELRSLLVECAIVILTRTKGWSKLKAWGMKKMKKKDINVAAAAVGRKLSVVMLRMWQDGKPFIWGEQEDKDNQKNKKMTRIAA